MSCRTIEIGLPNVLVHVILDGICARGAIGSAVAFGFPLAQLWLVEAVAVPREHGLGCGGGDAGAGARCAVHATHSLPQLLWVRPMGSPRHAHVRGCDGKHGEHGELAAAQRFRAHACPVHDGPR